MATQLNAVDLPKLLEGATLLHDPELQASLLFNLPLPAKDVVVADVREAGPQLRQSLPLLAGMAAEVDWSGVSSFKLASYLNVSTALEEAGFEDTSWSSDLFPATGQYRYTLVRFGLVTEGGVAPQLPRLPWMDAMAEGWARGTTGLAAIAAVDVAASAADQLWAVLNAWAEDRVNGALGLRSGLALVQQLKTAVGFQSRAKVGLDLMWMRHISTGKIEGDIGVQVDTGLAAELDWRLDGNFLAVMAADPAQQGTRLRLFRDTSSERRTSTKLSVAAAPRLSPQWQSLEFAATVLGLNSVQWLRDLQSIAAGAQNAASVALGALPLESLQEFFELWKALDAKTAAVLWEAAGNGAVWEQLAEWMRLIASETADENAFRAAVEAAAATDGCFGSPAVLDWMDLVAGGLLAATRESEAFQKLRQAAVTALALLEHAPAVLLLRELRARAEAQACGSELVSRVTRATATLDLDRWTRQQLEARLGELRGANRLQEYQSRAAASLALQSKVYQAAVGAVPEKMTLELVRKMESRKYDVALLDATFAFTAAGQQALSAAQRGSFQAALHCGPDDVRWRQGLLSHGLERRTSVEFHLPFIDRSSRHEVLRSLGELRVTSDAFGRVLAYRAEASDGLRERSEYQGTLALSGGLLVRATGREPNFTLAYDNVRHLSAGQAPYALAPLLKGYRFPDEARQQLMAWKDSPGVTLESRLGVRVPGRFVEAWLDVPMESSANFGSTMVKVSVAIQKAFRRWLPYSYFADPARFRDLIPAYSLLAYACSRPFYAKYRSNYTYDVMNIEHICTAINSARGSLPCELPRVAQWLRSCGETKLATMYQGKLAKQVVDTVHQKPRLFQSLLAADTFFVDEIVRMGAQAASAMRQFEQNPEEAVRKLMSFSEKLVSSFHSKLRRLYAGKDFLALGSLLFIEATHALGAAMDGERELGAVLRLKARQGSTLLWERTYLNSSF